MFHIDVDARASGRSCIALFDHIVNLLMERNSAVSTANIERFADPGCNHVKHKLGNGHDQFIKVAMSLISAMPIP